MFLDKHILSIIKLCCLQVRDFRRICPFMYKIAAITLANAFIYSYLNFFNSLFYGLPRYSIHRLQKIQLLASLVVRFVFLTQLHLLYLYIGFQYFIVLMSKYVV